MLVFITIACKQQDCMLPMGQKITNLIIMIYVATVSKQGVLVKVANSVLVTLM